MSTQQEGMTAQLTERSAAPVLQVDDLSVAYTSGRRTRQVTHEVSLSIGSGDVVALVGESGSGKTTTARAVLGLLPENGRVLGGQIRLGGTDITGWSDKRMSSIRGPRIGWIPQDPNNSLNPLRRIGDSLAEVLRIHKWADKAAITERVIELLERVGIPEPAVRARQYPHQLSGGMKQRVLIASAIALEPDLLIADEATSALDVTVQRTILDLLDELRRETGTAILLVTHDLAVAADRATDVVVLSGGRVSEAGPKQQMLTAPRSEYTRRLLADAPAFATTARHGVAEVRRRLGELRGAEDSAHQVTPAVQVRDLVQEFDFGAGRRLRAVDGVSFQVAPGTTHALVGESGSGKTTTARAVIALTRPTSGEIRVTGEDLFALGPKALRQLRSRIQLVYQNPFSSLDPRQSVAAIIAEPLRNFGGAASGREAQGSVPGAVEVRGSVPPEHGAQGVAPGGDLSGAVDEPAAGRSPNAGWFPGAGWLPGVGRRSRLGRAEREARVAELLDAVALPQEVAGRRAGELSGGQRQRVAIARALAPKPELLVLDEAVSALDVSVQAQILDLLAGLQEELGVSYLFISHDLAVVRDLAHTVTVLSGGRAVESGITEEVFTDPQHPYTAGLLAAIPGQAVR